MGLFPTKYGSAGKPAPGYDVKVLKPDGVKRNVARWEIFASSYLLPPSTFQLCGMQIKDTKIII